MSMTGYSKLFGSIITSTIWREDKETKILWITMLALKDKRGIVEGSVPGLADMARLTLEETEKSLEILRSPDPHSRTKDHEGRRIQDIDGGWFIINHEKWRSKMNADERREYLRIKQQEYRARQQSVNKRKRKSTLSTHTDADAYTSKEGGANGSRPTSVEDWLVKLEQNPTYKGINVRQLHGKLVTWCEIRGLKPTLRRLVTWLNKEDKPMPKHSARADYKRNYAPPAREPTQEEIENARRIAHEETARFKEQFK